MARIQLGNIKGPKGDRGPAGERGPTGPPGADGRTVNLATTSENGLMSKEDKTKLDNPKPSIFVNNSDKKIYTHMYVDNVGDINTYYIDANGERKSSWLILAKKFASIEKYDNAINEVKGLYKELNTAIDGNTTRLKNANDRLERLLQKGGIEFDYI